MLYRLHVTEGATRRRIPLRDGENLVGSDPSCDVRLADPTVSRHHAVLVVTPQEVQVADLRSANGTSVAGEAVRSEPAVVQPGTTITFGTVPATVEQVDEDDAVPAPSRHDRNRPSEAALPSADDGDPPTTASTHPAQLFTLGHLPRLLDALADGQNDTAFIQEVGAALYSVLPCRFLEIRRLPHGSPVFAAGESAGTGRMRVGDDDLELEAEFTSAGRARHHRPLLDLAWRLARLSRPDSPAPRATVDVATRATDEGVPSVVPEVRNLFDDATRVARGQVHVLILGESGTGKDLMARFIHRASPRVGGPFLAVNCAALPQELLESELFGIEKGVATGVDARPGRFEAADGGTLFLDEIGDMSLEVQAKILRALEEGTVLRIGGGRPRRADVRVVAATNRDLPELLDSGAFRADLYHRIAGWEVQLPPLRERPADIPNLAAHFIEQESRQLGIPTPALSRAAMRALVRYPWPGNIRELRREIARAILFVAEDGLLESGMLSPRVGHEARRPPGGLKAHLERAETAEIQRALAEHGGHVASAADALEIPLSTLYRKLKASASETASDD